MWFSLDDAILCNSSLLVGYDEETMLNDTDSACVAIALVLCLKRKRKFAADPRNGTNEDRNTHTQILWQT